ncbi:hypothetical protein [Micromonospora sp. NPDC005324]|uniref:hypothetical protein n=1 Tax=Micromonospora sp. NPDC005324 TaxID=3157033 RepID=UPI0033B6D09A
MTERDALYEALWKERFGERPSPTARPVPLSLRRSDAADLHRVGGVIHSPPGPRLDGDVLRMAGYGWSIEQIAALIQRDDVYVTQVLAKHGRGPALEEGLAA